eukprot:1101686-Pyramimonas_sp.AAC.1
MDAAVPCAFALPRAITSTSMTKMGAYLLSADHAIPPRVVGVAVTQAVDLSEPPAPRGCPSLPDDADRLALVVTSVI